MPARPRGWAGAVLAAVMVGIVVNAVTLQRARHPYPFFAINPASPPPPAVSAPSSVPEPSTAAPQAPPVRPASLGRTAEVATASVAEASAAPPAPPPRPVGLRRTSETVSQPRSSDPIADMLRGRGPKDSQRLMTTAQNALVKLGYSIKIGGTPGADTFTALHDFEKAHGLAASTEVTPHLVRQLKAAATSAASR
jgi:hypothetical protein